MAYFYRIFQAPRNCDYKFMSYGYAMEHGGPKADDYVSVYAGEISADTIGQALEQLFFLHNTDNRPNGKGMHSLSASDVVTIDGVPYYCDIFGWSDVNSKTWIGR